MTPSLKALLIGLPAALLVGMALFVLWEIYAPGDPPPFQITGCEIAFLHESSKHDAGVSYRDYDLICIVRGSTPPPSCDDVIARYVATQGPLPKDVDVRVHRGDQPRAPDICRSHYHGDGTR